MASSREPAFSQEELTGLLTSVGGSHSRRLSPVEVGQLLRREVERGVSSKRLAEELQMPAGTSVVTWFLRLPDLPEEVQGLVRFGRPPAGLSLTQAAEIARLHPDEQAMRDLATQTIENGFTGEETRSVIQLMKRRGISTEAAVAEVLQGRPTIERRHVLIGTLSDEVRSRSTRLTNPEKERLLTSALRAIGVRAQDAKLSVRRYTLVLDDDEASRLRDEGLDADTLEAKLNEALKAPLQ